MATDDPRARLQELGLELPQLPVPAGSYLPTVRSGELLYVSGQIATANGEPVATGRVGEDVDLELAGRCAHTCALNLLAHVERAADGLGNVEQVLRLTIFVASAAGFNEQHVVANSASDLLAEVLGERGRHSRAAVGAAELPMGSPVEIDAVVRLAG